MASDIFKNEILQTQVGDAKKTVSKKSVSNEVKKEGGSLFDSLLKVAKTKVEEDGDLKTPHGHKEQTTLTKETAPKINENSVNKTILETKLVKKDFEQTLKDSAKVLQENANKPIEPKVNIEVKNTTKATLVAVTPVLDEISVDKSQKKLDKPITDRIIHNQKQEEKKGSLSLLDKMMQDIKNETPSDQKTTSKVSPQVKEEPIKTKVSSLDNLDVKKVVKEKLEEKIFVDKEGKSTPDSAKENIAKEVKKEVVKPTTEIKTVKVNNLLPEKENQSLKEEIVSKKVLAPVSLLDKMVQSIVDNRTEDQEIISDEKINLKKSEQKVVAKSDENVGKLFAELQNGIKLENKTQITKKDTSSNIQHNEAKESKILSSLADSLSGKTKIQKKVDEIAKLESLQDPKGQFGANIFLTSQKVQAEIVSKQKLTEAKEVLNDGEKTTKTIKKSAEILELKPKGIELSTEEIPVIMPKNSLNKSNELGIHNQQNFLNRVFLNKDNINQINDAKVVEEKIIQTKLSVEDAKKVSQDVTITVERTLVETFTTKVIASKQAMGSFMSDVARNMYLNYKPPLTAFKIQLDPLNLGSIAIVMRNNKSENTLSISLNMSQNTTYETFNDNKSALQNALGRVFNQNEGAFSLDFGMQNDSSNQEFEQQRQNQENRQIIQNRIDGEATSQDDGQMIDLETTKSYM